MIGTSGIFLSAMAEGKGRSAASSVQSPARTKIVKTTISLVKTSDRQTGIKKAIDLLGMNPVKDRDVLLKPNFNTADRYPGSTHNETLINLIRHLNYMGRRVSVSAKGAVPLIQPMS